MLSYSQCFCRLAFTVKAKWETSRAFVIDPSGGVLPGAEVAVLNIATNIRKMTSTTEGGEYNVPVSPGTYQIQVSMPGFKRHMRDGVVVSATNTVRLDFTLEVGDVTDSIEVSTDVAQVQTENGKISTSMQNRLVDELPLVVGSALRSPFDLVKMQIGLKLYW